MNTAVHASYQKKLTTGVRRLKTADSFLAAWINQLGKCTLEVAWERTPYQALVSSIAFQQLHGKAAQTILNRLIAACPGEEFPSPESVSALSIEQMRSCGFSQAKVTAIQGIAQAAIVGQIPNRQQAEAMTDEELISRLTTLRGVGRWTVEMLLIFTLGRLNVMPVNDYGVQAGVMQLYGLDELPKKYRLLELTEHWKPYRSLGSWYMWRLVEARRVKNAV